MKPSADGMDLLPQAAQAATMMGDFCFNAVSGNPAVSAYRSERIKHMTKKIAKMIVIAGVALAAVPALSACNTIEGAGKDVQAGGEAVSDAAKDAKN